MDISMYIKWVQGVRVLTEEIYNTYYRFNKNDKYKYKDITHKCGITAVARGTRVQICFDYFIWNGGGGGGGRSSSYSP